MSTHDPLLDIIAAGAAYRVQVKAPPLHAAAHWQLSGQACCITPLTKNESQEFAAAVESSRVDLEAWLPWTPQVTSRSTAARYLKASEDDWESQKAFRFAIRQSMSSPLIGVVSLEQLNPHHHNADLGYWLERASWGRGIASEASRLILQFGFETLGLKRIRCAAATMNQRSIRLIERLGFQFEGIARQAELVAGDYLDHRIYALLDSDFAAQAQHRSKGRDKAKVP